MRLQHDICREGASTAVHVHTRGSHQEIGNSSDGHNQFYVTSKRHPSRGPGAYTRIAAPVIEGKTLHFILGHC